MSTLLLSPALNTLAADDDADANSDISSSSSIGSPSDSDSDSDGAESNSTASATATASTTTATSSLTSLSSLEDSLPFKRSLSTHFVGKARSFCDLGQCAAAGNAADLVKHESPVNKRRRIQIASRRSYKRRASCGSLISPILPPLMPPVQAVEEAENENDDDDDSDNDNNYNEKKSKTMTVLRSPRSLPLFDLRCG